MSAVPVPAPPSVRPFALTGTSRPGTVVAVHRRSNLCLFAVSTIGPDGTATTVSGPRPGQPANPNDGQLAGMIRSALDESGWDGGHIQAYSPASRSVLSSVGMAVDPRTAHGEASRALGAALAQREQHWLSDLVLTTDASMRSRGEVSGSGWVLDYRSGCGETMPDPITGMGIEPAHRSHGIAWAELAAIRRGVRAVLDRHPVLADGVGRLTIRTDSRVAIAKLRSALRGQAQGREWDELCQQILRCLVSCQMSLEWVRGHNGDPANEAADRLAMLARRNREFGTDEHTGRAMRLEAVGQIRSELLATRP